MTRAEYARHRGVSRMAVTKAIRSRRIPIGRDGRIDVAAADAAWLSNTDPSRAGLATEVSAEVTSAPAEEPVAGNGALELAQLPAGMDYMKARTLREYNAALRLQQQRLYDAGRLLDSDEWYDVAYNAVRSAAELMQTSADRIAPTLVGLTDVERIREILNAEHERIRAELMKAALPPSDEDAPAAEKQEAS